MIIEKNGILVQVSKPVPSHWQPPHRATADEIKADKAVRSVLQNVGFVNADYRRPGKVQR